MESPWYLDWQLWTMLTAVAALVLSQLPPVRLLLRRTSILCDAQNRIMLSHKIGIANIQWHLSFENKGGREAKIDRIGLKIMCPDRNEIFITAGMYQRADNNQPVLFSSIKLKPGEEWSSVVWMLEDSGSAGDREVRMLESQARKDLSVPVMPNSVVNPQISDDTLEKVMRFFNKKYRWVVGEYNLDIVGYVNGIETLFSKYRFVLYDHDEEFLMEASKRYISGDGLSYVSAATTWLNIPVVSQKG